MNTDDAFGRDVFVCWTSEGVSLCQGENDEMFIDISWKLMPRVMDALQRAEMYRTEMRLGAGSVEALSK